MKNPNRNQMVPSNQQQNNTDGSALVWVVAVLAILMIMVFSAVTVAMAFAVKASKHNLEQQLFYTARSGLDMIIKDQCDVDFAAAGKTDVISGIAVGGSLQNIAINFNSPEPLNPMGDCTAEIQRISDTKAKITVTAKYENLAQSSISAVVNFVSSENTAPPCVMTSVNSLTFEGNKQTVVLGENSDIAVLGAVSVNSNATDPVTLPFKVHGSGPNNIYCDIASYSSPSIALQNSNKFTVCEPFSVTSVSFPNRPAYYVDPQTGSLINEYDDVCINPYYYSNNGKNKIYFSVDCGSVDITVEQGKVCYLRVADNVNINSLAIRTTNYNWDKSIKTVVILDCGDNSYVNLEYSAPSVTMYGGGANASLKMNTKSNWNDNGFFTGALCFGNLTFHNSDHGNADMTFTYEPSDEMQVIKDDSSSGGSPGTNGKWKFVKYVTPETEVPA